MMKQILIALLISASATCFAQSFVLGDVNTDWFETEEGANGELYDYLNANANPVSGRKVIAFYDFDLREHPCHYGRSYEGGVYYEMNSCEEEGGDNEKLFLPADTDIDKLKAWIETFAVLREEYYTSENFSWQNGTYAPHGEAGCYYTISEDQYGRKVVEIYCGC
ncbi:MAG: hypothetical protein HWD92_01905 [Flavobacteriia bacterium]|nr:hypothetical protein [Flavobacteriia bacterium]